MKDKVLAHLKMFNPSAFMTAEKRTLASPLTLKHPAPVSDL